MSGRGQGGARRTEDGGDAGLIWGLHAVAAALANPQRRIRRLAATQNALARLEAEAGKLPIEAEIVAPEAIDRALPEGAVHQGVMLHADPLPPVEIDDLADKSLVVVLDQVTDPQNVGAILRSAAAFGVDALVLTHRHAPGQTGVLAKAASGALEHVPLVAVTNLARALDQLADLGFQRIGLDSEGGEPLEAVLDGGRLALVLGAEGRGLRQLTRARCDLLARLDIPGAIKSLNVSNAAALALYAAHRARCRP